MLAVNPYLNFNGNCGEAFDFYRSVFGGEFASITRFKDIPSDYSISEKEAEKIVNVSLPLGPGFVLMGSDVPEAYGQVIVGTNSHILISTESEDETTKLFTALSTGGQITMPLDKTFWGAYFGMLTDKFGIQWMVSYDYNQPTQEK